MAHGEPHFDPEIEKQIEPIMAELSDVFHRHGLKGPKYNIAFNAMTAMVGNTIGMSARSVDELAQNVSATAEAIASRAELAFIAKTIPQETKQ